ncbi:MAG: hypothetical protein JXR87_01780 [Candidatus Marinimicrobia bacterium]|nr:hypothetical protein [Candidatus Neomarinimicrobiota bacterium]
MLKKIVIPLLLISPLFAEIDWFGYYEGEGDIGKIPTKGIFYGYNKLRLDLDTNPSENIRISANVIYREYYGQTNLNFIDFIHPGYWPIYPNTDQSGFDTLSYVPYTLSDSLFIDNMFMQFHHRFFDLTLGKQQIATGVGYAWNPTDIFNLKDLMDPTYENTGISAIALSIPIGTRTTLSGILQPENSWSETIQYCQLKTGIGQFDISALYSRSLLTLTRLFGPTAQTHDLYGFNLEGEIFNVGVRTEIATHRLDYSDKLNYEYIIGLDYTFKNSLYILTEYYHNDLGAKSSRTLFDDYMVYYSGERKSLNQNYLFTLVMYPLGNLLDFSAFGIINLDDKSVVFAPQLMYRIFENVELSILGSWFIGEKSDEYGYQQYGFRFRIRAYF